MKRTIQIPENQARWLEVGQPFKYGAALYVIAAIYPDISGSIWEVHLEPWNG